jgi:large subunit ribosomal protein L18
VRKKVRGTQERPRLVIFRSLKHITAQLVDDVSRRTLATVSSTDLETGRRGEVARGGQAHRPRQGAGITKSCSTRWLQISLPREGVADGAREGGWSSNMEDTH